jgi:peptidoglycan lytic transglycosylase
MAWSRTLTRRIVALALLACLAACAAPAPPPPAPTSPPPEQPVFDQKGMASWYGPMHQGHLTANGESFDMHSLTAAHRSLSFGTIARVTNLSNGRTVKVRINDRGPYVRSRILDLSKRAADELGMTGDGAVRVRIEVYQSDQHAPVNR